MANKFFKKVVGSALALLMIATVTPVAAEETCTHSMTWYGTKSACTAVGEEAYTCEKCGYVERTREVPVSGHGYYANTAEGGLDYFLQFSLNGTFQPYDEADMAQWTFNIVCDHCGETLALKYPQFSCEMYDADGNPHPNDGTVSYLVFSYDGSMEGWNQRVYSDHIPASGNMYIPSFEEYSVSFYLNGVLMPAIRDIVGADLVEDRCPAGSSVSFTMANSIAASNNLLSMYGYTFGGWSLRTDLLSDPNCTADNITCDMVYDAILIRELYTVTYEDGVDGEAFVSQSTANLKKGASTPAFEGTPTREGYTFTGWSPEVASTVTADVVYTAQWSSLPYTITYEDGVGGEIFDTQVYENCTYGDATPAFEGSLSREGYSFAGWSPAVSDTVTGDATYVAQWDAHAFTITYEDGADDTVFLPSVFEDCIYGTETPAFDKSLSRPNYIFTGWSPAVADIVTGDAVYTAQWEDYSYTVTYDDGANGDAFSPQVYTDLAYGDATPAFQGYPTRFNYSFVEWSPSVESTVTGDITYVAKWVAHEVTEPEVTEPEVTEPEVTEPEITEPEITEPEETVPVVVEPEVVDIPDEPTPLVEANDDPEPVVEAPVEEAPVEEPFEELPEEEVPLTDIPDEEVPLTGDNAIWYGVFTLSVLALGAVVIDAKRRAKNAQ